MLRRQILSVAAATAAWLPGRWTTESDAGDEAGDPDGEAAEGTVRIDVVVRDE
jgi:hypothetical protein